MMQTEYILDESKWFNFNSKKIYDSSALYHKESGLYCCLGLIGLQCGVPTSEMKGVSQPFHLKEKYLRMFPFPLNKYSRYTLVHIIHLNDAPLKMFETLAERQLELVNEFKKLEIHVRFVTGK